MIPGWNHHPWRLRLLALALAFVLAWLPGWLSPSAVSLAEGVFGDAIWRMGAAAQVERRVVVVDIDEYSLAQLGPWPWSRETMAQLSRRLSDAGALVQGYDIAFADGRDGDDLLRDAWAAAPVVVSQILSIDAAVTPTVGALAEANPRACPPDAPKAYGHYGTSRTLLQARPVVGHITPHVEADGVVRRLPALICTDLGVQVSLPLAMLWRAAQAPTSTADRPALDWRWYRRGVDGRAGGWLGPSAWLTSSSLPGVAVPLEGDGSLRVPYGLSRSAFLSVPAADVLRGRIDPALLRGALVLVGATAFGTGDTVSTPLHSVSSGLEVHAQTLVGLLDRRVPYTPAAWPWLQAFSAALVATLLLGVAMLTRGAPARRLPLSGVVLAAGIGGGAALALLQAGLWLPWLSLALFALMASVALATVEHALARAQGERLSAHLGAYLPQPVAERLMVSDPSGALQVEQRSISVMVADIRNFSAFAAHRPPEETAALLHAFCCLAVDVVERHGGMVENVIGDSIVAVWNSAPGQDDSHPLSALAAARELCKATVPLLASRTPITEHSPVQPLALGVGLECGAAIVGSFGPARRRAHAALGEPVSVANRIQQMTSDLSMPILIGPQLAAQLPADGLEPLGEYLLEGLGKHYPLFAPTGWSELITIDPQWASSSVAVAPAEPAEPWSRWGQPLRQGASASAFRTNHSYSSGRV